MTERLAAVVVTRNRLSLLRRCLDHMLRQTRPLDAVYVVDNASTDGTRQFLASCAQQVIPILLSSNTGSGGGQNAGLAQAYKAGFDWIWCCDDDGYPADTALAELTESILHSTATWLNSLVVDATNPHLLSFGLSY